MIFDFYFFVNFPELKSKMNRDDLIQVSSKMMVYLKTYNFKLCRKGLLERSKKTGLEVGEFASLENDFLKSIFNSDEWIEIFERTEKQHFGKNGPRIKTTVETNGVISIIHQEQQKQSAIGYKRWVLLNVDKENGWFIYEIQTKILDRKQRDVRSSFPVKKEMWTRLEKHRIRCQMYKWKC